MLETKSRFHRRYARLSDEQLLYEFGIMPDLTLESAIALRVELAKRGLGEDRSENYRIQIDMTPPETLFFREVQRLYKVMQLVLLLIMLIILVFGV